MGKKKHSEGVRAIETHCHRVKTIYFANKTSQYKDNKNYFIIDQPSSGKCIAKRVKKIDYQLFHEVVVVKGKLNPKFIF